MPRYLIPSILLVHALTPEGAQEQARVLTEDFIKRHDLGPNDLRGPLLRVCGASPTTMLADTDSHYPFTLHGYSCDTAKVQDLERRLAVVDNARRELAEELERTKENLRQARGAASGFHFAGDPPPRPQSGLGPNDELLEMAGPVFLGDFQPRNPVADSFFSEVGQPDALARAIDAAHTNRQILSPLDADGRDVMLDHIRDLQQLQRDAFAKIINPPNIIAQISRPFDFASDETVGPGAPR